MASHAHGPVPTERPGLTNERSERRATSVVQVHLRLPVQDVELLRLIASERDQTISAVVRHLLRAHHARRQPRSPE